MITKNFQKTIHWKTVYFDLTFVANEYHEGKPSVWVIKVPRELRIQTQNIENPPVLEMHPSFRTSN